MVEIRKTEKIKGFSRYFFDIKNFEVVDKKTSESVKPQFKTANGIGYYVSLLNNGYKKKNIQLTKLILGIEDVNRVKVEHLDGNLKNISTNNLKIIYKKQPKRAVNDEPKEKYYFYFRYEDTKLKYTQKPKCNYQRLVLNSDYQIMLFENIYVVDKVDRLGCPKSFVEKPMKRLTPKELIENNFVKQSPSKEEVKFFLLYEKNLGIRNITKIK